ncbi:hypothetical protein THAOC_32119, partial [Thalassiosira oceanica]
PRRLHEPRRDLVDVLCGDGEPPGAGVSRGGELLRPDGRPGLVGLAVSREPPGERIPLRQPILLLPPEVLRLLPVPRQAHPVEVVVVVEARRPHVPVLLRLEVEQPREVRGVHPLAHEGVGGRASLPVPLVAVVGAEDDEEGDRADEHADGVGVVDVDAAGQAGVGRVVEGEVDQDREESGYERAGEGGAVPPEEEVGAVRAAEVLDHLSRDLVIRRRVPAACFPPASWPRSVAPSRLWSVAVFFEELSRPAAALPLAETRVRTGARQSGPGLSLPSTAATSALKTAACRLARPSDVLYLAPRIRRLVSDDGRAVSLATMSVDLGDPPNMFWDCCKTSPATATPHPQTLFPDSVNIPLSSGPPCYEVALSSESPGKGHHIRATSLQSSTMNCVPVKGDGDEVCANCGKLGSDAVKLKNCNACRLVKYCGVDCQRAHRKVHKKACKQRAAEIKDEQLYSQGLKRPEGDFCPICTLPIPLPEEDHSVVNACCMISICSGCHVASLKRGIFDCAFCRTPLSDNDTDFLAKIQARVAKKDPQAILFLGRKYYHGDDGLQKDMRKAVELYTEAAELGSIEALFDLGNAYNEGDGVQQDKAKAVEFWTKAAMQGHVESRYNLGWLEGIKGNHDRAVRHWLISAKMGDRDSVENIKRSFKAGAATKEQYAEALKGYQDAVEEMKSHDRDEAKAYLDIRAAAEPDPVMVLRILEGRDVGEVTGYEAAAWDMGAAVKAALSGEDKKRDSRLSCGRRDATDDQRGADADHGPRARQGGGCAIGTRDPALAREEEGLPVSKTENMDSTTPTSPYNDLPLLGAVIALFVIVVTTALVFRSNTHAGDTIEGLERPEGDFCPICTLMPIPFPMSEHSLTMACCMKSVCHGCAMTAQKRGMLDCAFCRTPFPDNDADTLAMVQARVQKKDPDAILFLGRKYFFGDLGLQKDMRRAVELWTEAAELGSIDALFSLGNAYDEGDGVQQDKPKAAQFWTKAAMQGHALGRYNLGNHEGKKGNYDRALKHYLISAKMGHKRSLETIKEFFMAGLATKEQYAEALKGYQIAVEEMKSHDRDKARAYFEIH